MYSLFYSFTEILVIILPILLSIAFLTVIERKVIASIQRRIGPNVVGHYAILQPFADALKLLIKEQVIPSQAMKGLFFIAPIITLIFSLLGFGVIPFGPGLSLTDFSLGILYSLAFSSLSVYGTLFAGWSANSKYAFLGSLRATAQIISYELIYSAGVLAVIILSGSFNITIIIQSQNNIWYIYPLLPIFILFFISAIAETSRDPFGTLESESELVAGYITEHSGIIFVFFFLAEYASLVLMSTFTAILFLGGYNFPDFFESFIPFFNYKSIFLGIKSVFIMFIFVWLRASLPRIRFDQLIMFCWTQLLPLAIAFLLLVPSILVAFDIAPVSHLLKGALLVLSLLFYGFHLILILFFFLILFLILI